jgi:hypothetical protein
MKTDNLLWAMKRIQGELLKLDISLSTIGGCVKGLAMFFVATALDGDYHA